MGNCSEKNDSGALGGEMSLAVTFRGRARLYLDLLLGYLCRR